VTDITAAILVGGRARRLDGALKPALTVGDRTILERQLDALHHAGIHDVLLVGRWPASRVPGGRHVPDLVENAAALGAMYSALLFATSPIVVILAGDLPFVEPRLLRPLAAIEPGKDAVVPRTTEGWHPLCAGYRRSVAGTIKARLDRAALRVSDALSDMRVRALTMDDLEPLDRDGMLLMNVNTPDDHQRARRHARFRS
jgi:molybdopterin-guanine dinucleotide biosynthesis protein A